MTTESFNQDSYQKSTNSPFPPVIELQSSSSVLFTFAYQNHLLFLIPCLSTISPLVPFEFYNRFIDALHDFLGQPILSTKVQSHPDIISLVLLEMVEFGEPFNTEPNSIRDLNSSENFLTKILSTGGSQNSRSGAVSGNLRGVSTPSGFGNTAGSGTGMDTIPWRRTNVKHTQNELFVDIIESIDVILQTSKNSNSDISFTSNSGSAFYNTLSSKSTNKNGKSNQNYKTNTQLIKSIINGTIHFTSHLSGIPDLQLILDLADNKIDYPSLHPCVRLKRWLDNPGTLSFMPPDGKCLLATYSIPDVPTSNIGIVQIELKNHIGLSNNEFEIRVWTNMAKNVKGINKLKVTIVSDIEKTRNIKVIRASSGDLIYKSSGVAEWVFGENVPLGWNATLRGTIIKQEEEDFDKNIDNSVDDDEELPKISELNISDKSSNNRILFPQYVKLSYDCMGYLPSGIKVANLKLVSSKGMSDSVKPYKGVKYSTAVDQFIVR